MKSLRVQEVLHLFHVHSTDRVKVFKSLEPALQAQVLLGLSRKVQQALLKDLDRESLIEIIEHLDPDKATDVLQFFPKDTQHEILKSLSERIKTVVELLLEFDPNTAAGLMHLDYVQLEMDATMKDAIKAFKKHESHHGRPPIMVVLKNGKLKGFLPAYKLGLSKPEDRVRDHMKAMNVVPHNAERKEILHLFRSHPHEKVAVIGEHDNIIGILYSDDVLRLLREKEAESLYDFAGVHAEESVLDPASYKIKSRYKWLILNLGTAFLASFTVGLFNETIAKYVLLAVYMPIVAGMGGNSATQTLAVVVRGIALKQISLKNAWPTVRNEVTAGFVNGLINGLIVATVVVLVNQDVRLAIVLSIAMVVNLLVAGFFGTLIPLLMQKFGKDPAASATIFITTATDVLGFIAFLGLATLILQ